MKQTAEGGQSRGLEDTPIRKACVWMTRLTAACCWIDPPP